MCFEYGGALIEGFEGRGDVVCAEVCVCLDVVQACCGEGVESRRLYAFGIWEFGGEAELGLVEGRLDALEEYWDACLSGRGRRGVEDVEGVLVLAGDGEGFCVGGYELGVPRLRRRVGACELCLD